MPVSSITDTVSGNTGETTDVTNVSSITGSSPTTLGIISLADAVSGTLLQFNDSGASSPASSSASVDWGDGSSSPGQIVYTSTTGSSYTYAVEAMHTYLNAGTYTPTITLIDSGGATNTIDASTVTVSGLAPTPNSSGIAATINTALSDVDLGTFTPISGHTYVGTTIWGNGTTSTDTIGSVSGVDHIKATQGTAFTGVDDSGGITTVVKDTTTGSNAVVTDDLTINDESFSGSNDTITTTQDDPYSDGALDDGLGAVASFTYGNTSVDSSYFGAQVDWGDGTVDPDAVVSGSDGSFTVRDTHAYTTLPTGSDYYTMTVTVQDQQGTTITLNPHAIVLSLAPTDVAATAADQGNEADVTWVGPPDPNITYVVEVKDPNLSGSNFMIAGSEDVDEGSSAGGGLYNYSMTVNYFDPYFSSPLLPGEAYDFTVMAQLGSGMSATAATPTTETLNDGASDFGWTTDGDDGVDFTFDTSADLATDDSLQIVAKSSDFPFDSGPIDGSAPGRNGIIGLYNGSDSSPSPYQPNPSEPDLWELDENLSAYLFSGAPYQFGVSVDGSAYTWSSTFTSAGTSMSSATLTLSTMNNDDGTETLSWSSSSSLPEGTEYVLMEQDSTGADGIYSNFSTDPYLETTATSLTVPGDESYSVYADEGSGVVTAESNVVAAIVPTISAAWWPLNAAALSSTSVLLSWPDYCDNETGFDIYRNTSNTTTGSTLVTTTAADATSYVDTGLPAATEYYYWIEAVGFGGNTGTGSSGSSVLTEPTISWSSSDTPSYDPTLTVNSDGTQDLVPVYFTIDNSSSATVTLSIPSTITSLVKVWTTDDPTGGDMSILGGTEGDSITMYGNDSRLASGVLYVSSIGDTTIGNEISVHVNEFTADDATVTPDATQPALAQNSGFTYSGGTMISNQTFKQGDQTFTIQVWTGVNIDYDGQPYLTNAIREHVTSNQSLASFKFIAIGVHHSFVGDNKAPASTKYPRTIKVHLADNKNTTRVASKEGEQFLDNNALDSVFSNIDRDKKNPNEISYIDYPMPHFKGANGMTKEVLNDDVYLVNIDTKKALYKVHWGVQFTGPDWQDVYDNAAPITEVSAIDGNPQTLVQSVAYSDGKGDIAAQNVANPVYVSPP